MDSQALQPWRPPKRSLRQCSSFAAMDTDFDVFLNHRGPDTKPGFVAHLDEALRAAGLNPFMDKASLRKGDPAFKCIDDALEVAKVHVAVVSKGYADSKYCLSELVTMMRSGKPVIPVYYEVEPGELRRVENGQFAAAFEKHKSKRIPEQVEEWRDALRQLADITGFCFRLTDYKGNEAELKREVVDAVLSKLAPTFEALQVDHHMVGVKGHVRRCIKKLEKMFNSTYLLGLVGMGGVGKTSLAKVIYNHFVGHKKFQAMSFLAVDRNLSLNMEVRRSLLRRLHRQLLWDLLHVPSSNDQCYSYWFHKLSNRGPVLVVLDDIHERSQFDELILDRSLLAQGSCIIVTSRDRHLLKVIGGESNFYLHEVTPLESHDSQKLFNLHAFGNEEAPQNFKAIASHVSNACGGLPLALKVVGSSLFDKRSNEDLKCIWPEAVDALKGDHSIIDLLRWSYDRLSEAEKLMFVDIASVFCGREKEEAIEIWKSCKECSSCCGYRTPYMTLRDLIDKSLVVIDNSQGGDVLAMHGLLRDLGESIGISNGSHVWEDGVAKVMEDSHQVPRKVRVLNLANSKQRNFEYENFAKMANLHYLILDGCHVRGNRGSIPKELRWLRWKFMPLTCLPPRLNLSKLVSLDFSESIHLASLWAESDPTLEACPNLLRLYLRKCRSITTLPESVGRLSKLQILDLTSCKNLQKLPSSIGQLTGLESLHLQECKNLEALPDSITALSGLQHLYIPWCASISKLPPTLGLMTGLTQLHMDLATEWQAHAIGQLHALHSLGIMQCTDEGVTALDSSGTFRNLGQLSEFKIHFSSAMTKLPETIVLLTNLEILHLWHCEEVRELPNSIGQLKMLKALCLRDCSSLETLPDCLGALPNLRWLWIVRCTSFTKLPASIGHLSSLGGLRIEGCGELHPLPDSLRHLNALGRLEVMDCGSLEGLGVLRVLQGLRIWGCTSITELPGSCLMVLDGNFEDPAWYYYNKYFSFSPVHHYLEELRLVEANDCGFLRHAQDTKSGRLILQRVYDMPCCKLTV